MTPDHNDLWFLPLGGTGEIGMNLNLYGHDGRWLMVDCGVTFPRPGRIAADGSVHHPGEPPVQMADPAFIADRRDQLAGLVITHAHEDHIGAVPYLWPLLQCPVYTSRFTAEILRRKLAEFDLLHRVPIHVVDVGNRRMIGPFEVEWLALTHSIPDPNALMIRTGIGNIFHSGDWKLDDRPLVGHGYSKKTFTDLADEGVDAMVCDSTNATVPGHSVSEAALHHGLLKTVAAAKGRVVVTCFGSNIARLHTLAAIARETGRYMGLLGRSLINMSGAAKSAGLWDAADQLINPSHIGYLPRSEVLAVATGSQGEPRTALRRLASGNHPDFELEAGDTVIFSARAIPGNEEAIGALISSLQTLGVAVITAEDAELPIHASGHPAQEELALMYRWVRPSVAIPVHGEAEHMKTQGTIAKANGVPRTLVGRNGDLFMIRPVPGIRRQITETGRLGWDKQALVRVE
ncbi:MBL fold metallo-hydrolase [Marinobacter vulgaris]|uniref:MBL fold metallo-hydrolase n=1 Tax=Marinobacter vulgaris TaxID=1928331 RepID=A0A2V3ZRD7_9GAMM|nr:ribonuclease J [Marinobacter vulgaris]PXX92450.1 MBL fold metallo-hydrolase [Marinobacter vulgaris]TSJ71608.1 ribonuclease J [Marinobacter vulgaris]